MVYSILIWFGLAGTKLTRPLGASRAARAHEPESRQQQPLPHPTTAQHKPNPTRAEQIWSTRSCQQQQEEEEEEEPQVDGGHGASSATGLGQPWRVCASLCGTTAKALPPPCSTGGLKSATDSCPSLLSYGWRHGWVACGYCLLWWWWWWWWWWCLLSGLACVAVAGGAAAFVAYRLGRAYRGLQEASRHRGRHVPHTSPAELTVLCLWLGWVTFVA